MKIRVVNYMAKLLAAALVLQVSTNGSAQPSMLKSGQADWAQGAEYRLKVKSYYQAGISSTPILLVVLHGDSPQSKPSYHYAFAARAAMESDVVAIGLLRPGYEDPDGNISDGERGQSNGDNFNARNTDSIAAAISELKIRYRSRKVVLAGHSGGAVIAANILGRHPDIADSALLVSCACDVVAWRESFFRLTGFPSMLSKIETLSPIDLIKGIAEKMSITLVVGQQDKVTPPKLSEDYVNRATELGKNMRIVVLEGKGHEIFDSREVYEQLLPLLR
jgi:alpha-beta hydrolase superfamily lysophospholipase